MELSAKAAEILAALEARDPAPVLAPSATWGQEAFDDLAACADADVLAEAPINVGMARAVRSGLLLWNDSLDLAHTLAMSDGEADELTGQTLDYWHGIMHRREPDYPNASYWFRRVGQHPAFDAVLQGAKDATARSCAPKDDEARAFVEAAAEWDAFAFIALCEKYETATGVTNRLLRAIQVAEIRVLLDFSVAHAASAVGEG
jgi:hypothetical protein